MTSGAPSEEKRKRQAEVDKRINQLIEIVNNAPTFGERCEAAMESSKLMLERTDGDRLVFLNVLAASLLQALDADIKGDFERISLVAFMQHETTWLGINERQRYEAIQALKGVFHR